MDALQGIGDLAIHSAMAPALKGGLAGGERLDKTAQDFEAMFLTQMLQPMFETIKVDPSFGGGNGEKIMRGFLVQEYGKVIASTRSLGIAEAVRSEMIRLQEQAASATALQGANP